MRGSGERVMLVMLVMQSCVREFEEEMCGLELVTGLTNSRRKPLL